MLCGISMWKTLTFQLNRFDYPLKTILQKKANVCFYYPNLVILPVDNNEHQRIDDVSTDRISYDIQSVETMGFAL